MKQIIVSLETPEIQALERTGEKDMISKVNLTMARPLTFYYMHDKYLVILLLYFLIIVVEESNGSH